MDWRRLAQTGIGAIVLTWCVVTALATVLGYGMIFDKIGSWF